ncbi:MAG: anaerobic ribonucleoside-triphosphate reductase [Minisyncoccales bacterium]
MANGHSKGRTKCQRVTRCVGYFRPIDQMNEGKQQEVEDRKLFDVGSRA